MDRARNILLLSPYLPAQDTTACARKIFDSLVLLKRKNYSINLISFCSREDNKRVGILRQYCDCLQPVYINHYRRYPFLRGCSVKKKIIEACRGKGIEIIQCETGHMGRYLPVKNNIPSILVEHEILSVSFFLRSKVEKNLIRKAISLLRAAKKFLEESIWYRRFDKIVVFSQNDKEILGKLYRVSDIEVIPLGLNLANYPVRENSGKEYDLVFVGNFSHFPNIDGVFYFITKILPLIKRTIPGLSVAIAGAHPPESIKRMAKPGSKITVTGYLGDIKDVYYKARVFITPVRFGTGMRYKILEAQALELPVISTSVAAGGIDRRSLIVADTAYDFSEEIVGLLQDPSRRFDLAKRGRLSVEKNHDSCVLIEKYEFIYNELLNPS